MNLGQISRWLLERCAAVLQYPAFFEISLLVVALAVLLFQAFMPMASRRRLAWNVILLFGSLLTLSFLPVTRAIALETTIEVFGTSFRIDPWTVTFRSFFLLTGLGVSLLSLPWLERQAENVGEYLSLMVLAVLAMMMSAGVADFAMLFVVLEFLTITSYVLVAFLRNNPLSLEAGVKYLVVGAVASAVMVYGITLVYGATGHLQFADIDKVLSRDLENPKLIQLGLLLIMAGLGFKIAAFPFQWWVPDVYQGAPLPTVALLSVGSKAAGFVLLIRVLHDGFLHMRDFWEPLLGLLAAVTILYGALAAMTQNNLKRLMGYSSISHAGYMMTGLAAGSIFGQQALIFYLYAYLFGALLVFCAMTLWETPHSQHEISEYAGLRERSPWLAGALIVGLVSLAGIPPLIGFFGKFLLLIAVLRSELFALAAAMLIGVGCSLYYYLRIVRAVYFVPGDIGPHPVLRGDHKAILAGLMAAAVLFGFYQDPIWQQATAEWLNSMF